MKKNDEDVNIVEQSEIPSIHINVNLGFRVHRLTLMFYISLSLYLLFFLQLYIKLVNHSWPQDIEMVDVMQ